VAHVALAADRLPPSVLDLVRATSCRISLAGPIEQMATACDADERPDLFLVALSSVAAAHQAATAAEQTEIDWVAWNLADVPEIATAAYEAGARAVLPAKVSTAAFARTLLSMQPANGETSIATGSGVQTFRRGERLKYTLDQVLVVHSGVAALTFTHDDGVEILTGLCGPGKVVIWTGEEGWSVLAHTDLSGELRSWAGFAADPRFVGWLRTCLCDAQAWTSIRGHPHLERRILGLLDLLAKDFAGPHPDGTVVELGLTHTQLAAAVGTTRATLSRQVAAMRRRGDLRTVQVAGRRRFLLPSTTRCW